MKHFLILFCLASTVLWSCTSDDSDITGNGTDGRTSSINNGIYDNYKSLPENPFIKTEEEPVSTFSIDADGASYANIRRFISQEKQLPPAAAVRTEELINYFNLDYPFQSSEHPISLNGEVSGCPWNTEHKLIRIGIKGQPIEKAALPSSNFVFLIDVSGSMKSSDKLEMLKSGFKLMVDQLTDDDRISIVTYAGSNQIVLNSAKGSDKETIKTAIDNLSSGGGTNGAQGIISAYNLAANNIIKGGNNRVILGTDGDFNIGPSSSEDLINLIKTKRDMGIFLTVLGVGRGNLNDAMMEQIANNGNGTYEYIDKLEQLKKIFIYDYSKFFYVAKDVKVQVNFNPDNVESYRLIGYENRVLNNEDFVDDGKDAGELGANQDITALYEIVPKKNANYKSVPSFTIDFRYKLPDEDASITMKLEVYDNGNSFDESSDYMRFTASVASFSLILRNSEYKGNATYSMVSQWLATTQLSDPNGFKEEFKNLVIAAGKL